MKRLYKHSIVKFQVLFLFGVVSQFSVFAQAETDKQQPLAYELQVEIKPKTYDPATQSRIRVYRKGATKTLIQHSFDCAGRKAGIRDYLSGNGALSALKAYARITFNIEEGMPRSVIQKEAESNAMRTYQLISYKEFILNADQPVNLYGFVFGATDSSRTKAQVFDQCVDAVASFRPQAGHDYEILGKYQNNQCQFQVFDLKTNQEVTVSDKLYACPEKSWKFWKRDQ
ncbi:hypothetical protein GJV03_17455 [Acinetobacter sp. RIT698]|uniref:hypothetical protein n=1 Tax=Acinetobacter sp. RIT698 TaxID=2666192 RepID=UPI0012AD17F2|nr:hypothetical protein [Acinetobacter sp. RIT698]MRT38953.1 hypothetical protein [Acinetobacter sp. RIT698]